ncbi:Retrotransposon gag domain [Lasallia pustulata]|uniref:Retrotransposon gag domain n=1 Tax=Lasallia pustulata TaxID=136370 RepID=A0A1W5DDA1_9LECA|nr:Retrotransposon gag domain [Lasallia pustulata]
MPLPSLPPPVFGPDNDPEVFSIAKTPGDFIAAISKNPAESYDAIRRLLQSAVLAKEQYYQIDEQYSQAKMLLHDAEVVRNELQEQISRGVTKIALLKGQLAVAEAGISTNIPPAAARIEKSEKLEGPPMFSGKSRDKLPGWVAGLWLKLQNNADRFLSDQSQITYAISRKEGKALAQLLPYVQDDGTVGFDTITDLIKYLQIAFGDPDKKGTALKQLETHTQKNQTFSEYYGEFRHLSAIAKLTPESQRIFLLRGINDELRAYLRNNDPVDNLDELATQLQKADTRNTQWAPLRPNRLQNQTSRPAQSTYGTAKSTVSSHTTTPSTVQYTPPPTPSLTGGDPMDLSRQRFQLSKDKKPRRS